MVRYILLLLLLLSGSALPAQSAGHTHETHPSTARADWGDFANGEHIKTRPVDVSQTPIFKKIARKGELEPEFAYVDSIDIRAMVYESDGLMVTGFVVAPKAPGNYPCVIFNRGGNRDFGRLLVANAVMQMGRVAADGYVVIASNYRGNSNSEGREEFGGADVNDVLNLIPALAEIENADTSRIGLFGISRGGMMTYLALKRDPRFKTAVVLGGVADLFETREARPDMESHVFAELIPHYADSAEIQLSRRSVVRWPEALDADCPLLMLHGTKDDRVAVAQADSLAHLLSRLDRPFRLMRFHGENHGISGRQADVMAYIRQWLNSFLRDEELFDEPGGILEIK